MKFTIHDAQVREQSRYQHTHKGHVGAAIVEISIWFYEDDALNLVAG